MQTAHHKSSHSLKSFQSKKRPFSRRLMVKLYTMFETQVLENHTLFSGTYPHKPNRGVPPPPGGGDKKWERDVWCICHYGLDVSPKNVIINHKCNKSLTNIKCNKILTINVIIWLTINVINFSHKCNKYEIIRMRVRFVTYGTGDALLLI